MLCPHKVKYLTQNLINVILQENQRQTSQKCSQCNDGEIICLGCLEGACDRHLHSCSPIVYIPSQNILFCRQCNCQLLSLHLTTEVQRQVYTLLQAKYVSKRSYVLENWAGYDFLLKKQNICDFGQVYDYNAENVIWDDALDEEIDENTRLDQEIASKESELQKLQQEAAQLTSDVMTAEKKKEHKQQKNARLAAAQTPTPEQNDTPRSRRRREKGAQEDSEIETSSVSERKRKRTHL